MLEGVAELHHEPGVLDDGELPGLLLGHIRLRTGLRSYTLLAFGLGAWYLLTSSDPRLISAPLAVALGIVCLAGVCWQGSLIGFGLYDNYVRVRRRVHLDAIEEVQTWGGSESGFLVSTYLLTVSDADGHAYEFAIDEHTHRKLYPRVGEQYEVEIARRSGYLFDIQPSRAGSG